MKRWAVIAGAVVLAALGTLLLMSYVQGAEERATEGLELATVLVVDEEIEQGTLASEAASLVRAIELPVAAVADDAITDMSDLSGLVASVDLVPGEQIIASRFRTPASLAAETRVEVPPELLQVTIAIDPERAVGGRLVPGDLVAFLASFDPFELNAVEPGDPAAIEAAEEAIVVITGEDGQQSPVSLQTPNSTHLIIHKVLVTGVQVEEAPRETAEGEATAFEYAPTGNLLITLAAEAPEIERMIFTAEHGFVWLALESGDAPEEPTPIQTRGNIYID